jgi:hypothetical protein
MDCRLAAAALVLAIGTTQSASASEKLKDFATICPLAVTWTDYGQELATRGFTRENRHELSPNAKAIALSTNDLARVVIVTNVVFQDSTVTSCSVTVDEPLIEGDLQVARDQLEASPIGTLLGDSLVFDGQYYHIRLKSPGSNPLISVNALVGLESGGIFTLERWDFVQ